MKIFLGVMIALYALNLAITLLNLAIADYPRKRETTRGLDVVTLLVSSGFMGWAIWLFINLGHD